MEKQTLKTTAKEYEIENKDKQVNTYDKILRENMEAALPGIISKILLLDIVRSRNIPDIIQHTKERKPDLLKKVTDRLGITYILHVEYQLTNLKSEMVHRMLEYKAMLIRKYNLPVKQFVIYIGKGKPTMQTELNEEDLTFRYQLIALSNIDYNIFLTSNKPELQIMGILANFNNDSKREALTKIVKAVQTNSKKGFKENITFKHLRILAQIPNFESLIVEIMETLDKYFKEERDPLYMRGVEKKNHEVVMNLLSANKFTDEEIAAFAGVYLSYVQKVRKELKNKTN